MNPEDILGPTSRINNAIGITLGMTILLMSYLDKLIDKIRRHRKASDEQRQEEQQSGTT